MLPGLFKKDITSYIPKFFPGYTILDNAKTIVPINVLKLTAPESQKLHVINDQDGLVGSAEQWLMYQLMLTKKLPPNGKFITASMCYRYEQEPYVEGYRQREFMKAEAGFLVHQPGNFDLEKEVELFLNFYKHLLYTYAPSAGWGRAEDYLEVVKTDQGYDINFLGREIGSYGVRHINYLKHSMLNIDYDYFYGTVLAEPRFSSLMNNWQLLSTKV